MQLAPGRAGPGGHEAFDDRVAVFIVGGYSALAGLVGGQECIQGLLKGIPFLLRQDLDLPKPPGVCPACPDVVGQQLAVPFVVVAHREAMRPVV